MVALVRQAGCKRASLAGVSRPQAAAVVLLMSTAQVLCVLRVVGVSNQPQLYLSVSARRPDGIFRSHPVVQRVVATVESARSSSFKKVVP